MSEILYLSDDKVFGPTLEGEGKYAGYPSIFMRLAMCNLTCKGFSSTDSPHGCDSFISWSKKNKFTYEELCKFMEKHGFIEELKKDTILKLTGGEPFLQQKNLLEFIEYFISKYKFVPRIDFESNATIQPLPQWNNLGGVTYTVSPKLSNNGDPEEKRYKPEILKWFKNNNACFKFVVKSEEDVREIFEKYINDSVINIPKELIWFMPCCGSREEQNTQAFIVAELCKKYNIKFSPRLQLLIWNKALKV